MKLTRNEVHALYKSIAELTGDYGLKFSYGIAKTARLLDDEIKAIETARKPPREIEDFQKKLSEVQNKYILKDADGNKIPGDREGTYRFDDKNKDYREQFEALKEQYKEHIEAFEKKLEGYGDFMKEEVEVTVHKLSIKEFPEKISPKALYSLNPIILEEEGEIEKALS